MTLLLGPVPILCIRKLDTFMGKRMYGHTLISISRLMWCVVFQTQECESLMRVVRELTENRSKLVCARTNLAEKLAEMQHEYMRSVRIADLSRVVSKENVAKTAKVVKTLKQVGDGCISVL